VVNFISESSREVQHPLLVSFLIPSPGRERGRSGACCWLCSHLKINHSPGEYSGYRSSREALTSEKPCGLKWGVKPRKIIDTFFEQLGLFLGPVFHRLKGRNVAQCFLRDVLIVDLERSV